MVAFRSGFPSTPEGWGIGLLLLTACASREVPTRYPDSSPASLNAKAAPPLAVTRTLDEDAAGTEIPASVAPQAGQPEAEPHGAHHHHGDHHGQ